MSESYSAATPRSRTCETCSFYWFLASTFACAVGRNGYHIACAWILVASGHGSPAVAGFFAIISLAELVASPFAGWLADRFDRRALYMIAEIARVVAALILAAVLVTTNALSAIWISAALFATCDRIALTASQSMIPLIGAKFKLATANSVTFFLMQSGSLAAAALIGLLLHASGLTYVFGAVSAGFVISAICMGMVHHQTGQAGSSLGAQGGSIDVDSQTLCQGAVYALLYTGGMLVSVIGASFVFDEHVGNAIDFGLIESAWSGGSIIGALLLIPLIRTARVPILQFLILGLSAVAFALLKVSDLPSAALAFAALGGLYNLGRVALEVMIQSSISNVKLGRAKGVIHSVGVLFGVLLFAIVTVVGDDVLPSTVFLAYGAILAAGAFILFFFFTKRGSIGG